MRYWLTSLTIPTFVVVCAMSSAIMGCTAGAKTEDKDAAARQAAAKALFVKDFVPQDVLAAKELAAKEAAAQEATAKDLAAKELVVKAFPKQEAVVEEIELKELASKDGEPKNLEVKQIATAPLKESKQKEKVTGKEPKKDSAKDPKKEVTVPEITEYMGKRFADWVKQFKDDDPTHREEAMKAVLMFGPKKASEAIPDILFQLERHKKIPVDLAVRVNGIMALSTIFRNTKPPHEAEHVKRALALYKLFLRDDQVLMKVRALQGLPYLGTKAREVIDDVVPLCNYPGTWEVRKEAIQTLVILAPDADGVPHSKVLPVLRNHMDWQAAAPKGERSYLVRLTAVQAIGLLAQDKMPLDLYKALGDPSDQVRLTALRSIAAVAGMLDGKKHLTGKDKLHIEDHLDSYIGGEKDKILKIWAYASIMTVTKTCTKARLAPVVALLDDTNPAVKMQALTVISLCQEKSKSIAYDAVLPMIHDENLSLAGAAMTAIVSMQAVEAIAELKKIVDDKKAIEIRKDTAQDAIDHIEHFVKMRNEKNEKDKKTPEKKK